MTASSTRQVNALNARSTVKMGIVVASACMCYATLAIRFPTRRNWEKLILLVIEVIH